MKIKRRILLVIAMMASTIAIPVSASDKLDIPILVNISGIETLDSSDASNIRAEYFRKRSDALRWCEGRGICVVEAQWYGAFYQATDPQRWGVAIKSY